MAQPDEQTRAALLTELEEARKASHDATHPDTVARFTQLILDLEERLRTIE